MSKQNDDRDPVHSQEDDGLSDSIQGWLEPLSNKSDGKDSNGVRFSDKEHRGRDQKVGSHNQKSSNDVL